MTLQKLTFISMLVPFVLLTAQAASAAQQASGTLYDVRHEPIGKVQLQETSMGVLLRIEAKGLEKGWHGMHFHEKGDCSDAAFKAAGGHVHAAKPIVHGFMVEGANDAGDLPNLFVNAQGEAVVELHSTLVSLTDAKNRPSLLDSDGAALVIHANPDDYTSQPIGGAGDRIGCAVIR